MREHFLFMHTGELMNGSISKHEVHEVVHSRKRNMKDAVETLFTEFFPFPCVSSSGKKHAVEYCCESKFIHSMWNVLGSLVSRESPCPFNDFY